MNLHAWIHWTFHISSLSIIWILNTYQTNAISIQQTNRLSTGLVYEQREILNSSKGLFGVLEWTINQNEPKIIFNLTQTLKLINKISVLGLSKTGNVDGAELVIIQSDLKGHYIAENVRGISKNVLKSNSRKRWALNSFNQNERNLTAMLSLDLNTCDHSNDTNMSIEVSRIKFLN